MTYTSNNEEGMTERNLLEPLKMHQNDLSKKKICIQKRLLKRRIQNHHKISKSCEKTPINLYYKEKEKRDDLVTISLDKDRRLKEKEEFLTADQQVNQTLSQRNLETVKQQNNIDNIFSLGARENYTTKRKTISSEARYQSRRSKHNKLNSPNQELIRSGALFNPSLNTKISGKLIKLNCYSEKSKGNIHQTSRNNSNIELKFKTYKEQRKNPSIRNSLVFDEEIKDNADDALQHHRLPVISPHSKLPKVFLNKGINNLKRIGRKNNETMLKHILKKSRRNFIIDKSSVEIKRNPTFTAGNEEHNHKTFDKKKSDSSTNIKISHFSIYGNPTGTEFKHVRGDSTQRNIKIIPKQNFKSRDRNRNKLRE
mmetsp:Transcript_4484/g.3757  ORF Transcript_4484/g.3757 Transcript_4484/m.3757 type:complete len:368 (+) Transcript_4484:3-1106(+)